MDTPAEDKSKGLTPVRAADLRQQIERLQALIADQQGLNSHAMLVTLTPPTPAEAQRARSQQIELIAGKGLGELGERLHDWICGGPAAGSGI